MSIFRAHPLLIINAAILFSTSLSSTNTPFSAYPYFNIPGLNYRGYSVKGDVNIGSLMSVTTPDENGQCFKTLRKLLWVHQHLEAVAFAVEQVNNDPSILPNVSLGFVILDYCSSDQLALAQSLAFLPMKEAGEGETCGAANASLSSNITWSSTDNGHSGGSFEAPRHFDVIGILGTYGTSSILPISALYAVAQRPIVSFMATGDELSDKSDHPYFMRVVPPDKIQARAMLTFIADNSWSYISVIYSTGPYGENGFENIEQLTREFNVCIATSHKVSENTKFDEVVEDLLNYSRARVVILFTGSTNALSVIGAAKRQGASGHFIWIGSDGLSEKIIVKNLHHEELAGVFTFFYYALMVDDFNTYFRNLQVNGSKNPWLESAWEFYGQCSFQLGTCTEDARFGDIVDDDVIPANSLVMDSVLTFAHAADRLLQDKCPNVIGAEARACIKGEELLNYMFNSSFEGYTGKIEFDGEGNLLGKYAIRQMKWTHKENLSNGDSLGERTLIEAPVAAFDVSTGRIVYNGPNITWDHLNILPRVVPLPEGQTSEIPESVCSRPCLVGEYKHQKELDCCWECHRCRENEKLKPDNEGCEPCPEFTWPEPATNYTTCTPIPPSYASISDTLSIIQVFLAMLAIIGELLVVTAYVILRKSRVIKAASRELSILQMVAIFVGYITVLLFQATPTHDICGALYFLFCLSFAWLYSPLIVKAVRIYRIFQSASKANRRPRFISPHSQVVMAISLIVVQVFLCLGTYSTFRPTAVKTQPVTVEKYVELSCDFTLPGLTSFLAYNLVLISACSAFAFMTRKLPDNFNESWFMFMCVSTTLVIWLAIVPTYFTASRERTRTLLLSIALLLNHTVALVFLFIPKIYAAVYVSPANFVMSRFHTSPTMSRASHMPGTRNRVAPIPSHGLHVPSQSSFANGQSRFDHKSRTSGTDLSQEKTSPVSGQNHWPGSTTPQNDVLTNNCQSESKQLTHIEEVATPTSITPMSVNGVHTSQIDINDAQQATLPVSGSGQPDSGEIKVSVLEVPMPIPTSSVRFTEKQGREPVS